MAEVIKDVNGSKLRLSKNYLTEVEKGADPEAETNALYKAKLSDIVDGEYLGLTSVKDYDDGFEVLPAGSEGFTNERTDFSARTIGCREFDKKTFDKILKAVKAAQKVRT